VKTVKGAPSIFHELATLLASEPSREELLKFRPSAALQRRARSLLARQGEARLNDQEQRELDELLHAELLMRLVKATIRAEQSRQE
jgi:hypothetical protein